MTPPSGSGAAPALSGAGAGASSAPVASEASITPARREREAARPRKDPGCLNKRQKNLDRSCMMTGPMTRELTPVIGGLNPDMALAGRVRYGQPSGFGLMVAIKK